VASCFLPYSNSFSPESKVNFDLKLIAPAALKPHLVPCRLDIDIKDMLVILTNGDGVGRDGTALDSGHEIIVDG